MKDFIQSSSLLFVLLNPFLMSVYLMDLIQSLSFRAFAKVLFRASIISFLIFSLFALFGDKIFTEIFRARFAAFQIFGGIIFLIVGVQFVLSGRQAIEALRGHPEHLSGSIAMPFMIGPGTVSASVLIGNKLDLHLAALAIAVTMVLTFLSLLAMKKFHDVVKDVRRELVDRYVEIVGRVMALFIGTFAVEMILQGVETWLNLSVV